MNLNQKKYGVAETTNGFERILFHLYFLSLGSSVRAYFIKAYYFSYTLRQQISD